VRGGGGGLLELIGRMNGFVDMAGVEGEMTGGDTEGDR